MSGNAILKRHREHNYVRNVRIRGRRLLACALSLGMVAGAPLPAAAQTAQNENVVSECSDVLRGDEGETGTENGTETGTTTTVPVWSGDIAEAFAGGDGSEESPYQIASAGQLALLAKLVNTGEEKDNRQWQDKYYKLTDDIVLSGTEWVPIGYTNVITSSQMRYEFYGHFDGGGHTVSGLSVMSPPGKAAGLFGYCKKGSIHDLKVSGTVQVSSAVYAGGICGYACQVTFTSCNSQVNVTAGVADAESYNMYAGGICGYAEYGSIQQCSNAGTVSAQNNTGDMAYAGGIAGYAYTVTACTNDGGVSASGTSGNTVCAGGITGCNYYDFLYGGAVTACRNTDTVSSGGTAKYLGGISGYAGGTVNGCLNTGTVGATGSIAGGVIGAKGEDSSVSGCVYQDGCVTGTTSTNTYGTPLTTEQISNGAAAYTMNQTLTGSSYEWSQKLKVEGAENLPTALAAETVTANNTRVYQGACTGYYSNIENDPAGGHQSYKYTQETAGSTILPGGGSSSSPTATVVCAACGASFGTVTLKAPTELTYDGNPKTVTAEVAVEDADVKEKVQAEVDAAMAGALKYYKAGLNGEKNGAALASAPKDVSEYENGYVAELTLGDATLSVQYTIGTVEPVLTLADNGTLCYEQEIDGNKTRIKNALTVTVNGAAYTGSIDDTIIFYYKDGTGKKSGVPYTPGEYEIWVVNEARGNFEKAESNHVTWTVECNELDSDVAEKVSVTYLDQDENPVDGAACGYSAKLTAPDGYKISLTPGKDHVYQESVVYSDDDAMSGEQTVTFYLYEEDQLIFGKGTVKVTLDHDGPVWTGDGCGMELAGTTYTGLQSSVSFDQSYSVNELTANTYAFDNETGKGATAYYFYADTSGVLKTKDELDELTVWEKVPANGTQAKYTLDQETGTNRYVIYAYAVDPFGNRSDYVCSNGFVIDLVAPTTAAVTAPDKDAGTLTDATAKIGIRADETGTTVYYRYAKTTDDLTEDASDYVTLTTDPTTQLTTGVAAGGAQSLVLDDANGQSEGTITLEGLDPSTEYHVWYVLVDRAGNASAVQKASFTTTKAMPQVTTAPKLTGTYGQKVSELTIDGGKVQYNGNTIKGAWSVTDTNAESIPTVGAETSYTVTFTPTDDAYEPVTTKVVPVIAKKQVTVTADDATRAYGEADPTFTFTVPDGTLVGSDTNNALGVNLSSTATTTSKVGDYPITGTADSTNYDVTVTAGTLTVKKAHFGDQTLPERSYGASQGGSDSVSLGAYVPADGGSVTYGTPAADSSKAVQATDLEIRTDGTLSYTVSAGTAETEGRVTVTVTTENYNDFTIAVPLKLRAIAPAKLTQLQTGTVKDTTATVTMTADKTDVTYYLYVTTDASASVSASDLESGTSNTTGSFTLSGLTAKTTYYVYAAAKGTDGVLGNMERLSFTTTETSASGGSSGGGSSSGGSAGGGAGGGGAAAQPDTPDDGQTGESENDGKVPQIKDENGKSGWDAIQGEVKSAKSGDTVTIQMNGALTVPGKTLKSLKGRDVNVTFELTEKLSLTVNGSDLNGITFKNNNHYSVLFLWTVTSVRHLVRSIGV